MSWAPNDLVADTDLVAYESTVLSGFNVADWTEKRRRALEDWIGPILRGQGFNLARLRTRYEADSVQGYTAAAYTDKIGAVKSFTFDNFAGSPSPPLVACVVDIEGARLYLQMTDVSPREVKLDMPVELVFRKIHEAGGTPNYYWKCTPVR